MALTQPHWAAGTLTTGNVTYYLQPMGASGAGPDATEAHVAFKVQAGGTARDLTVLLGTAPGGTATRTVTLRKNGVDQALTVTLAAADTTKSDTTHTFTVAAGDTLVVKFSGANSPVTTPVALVWALDGSDEVTSQYSVGVANLALGTTATPQYAPLFSAGGDWTTTAAQGAAVAGITGTIPGYRMVLELAPGAGKSRTFVIEKNGVAQDGTGGTPATTITISDTATTGSASFSLAVAATDLLRCQETATGTPAAGRASGCHTFTATTAGQLAFAATPNDAPTTNATEYGYPMGGFFTWGASEPAREFPGPQTALALTGLYVTLDAALGGSASHTYTLRKNTADTVQTVPMAAGATTAGPSSGASVSVGAGDRFALKVVTVSSATTNRPHLAFVLTAAAATAARTETFIWGPL